MAIRIDDAINEMVQETTDLVRSLGVAVVCIFFWIFNLAFNRIAKAWKATPQNVANKKMKIDRVIFEALNSDVIPTNLNFSSEFSQSFQDELQKYRQIVYQKASIGELFSSSIPFSVALFDSNQQLVWANDHFFNLWQIDKASADKTKICWRDLVKRTNLFNSHNDVALNKKYEIDFSIKDIGDINKEVLCEAHITPVKQNGEQLSMIFISPLKTDRELLRRQKNMIALNINNVINLITSISLNKHLREKIEAEFEAQDLAEIFHKFIKLHDVFNQQRLGLMNEISNLENQLEEKEQMVISLKESLFNNAIAKTQLEKVFGTLKEQSMLQNVLLFQWNESFSKMLENYKSVIMDEEILLEDSEHIDEIIKQNSNMLRPIYWSKDDFDKIKDKFSTIQAKISDMAENRRPLTVENIGYVNRELEKMVSLYQLALANMSTSLEKVNLLSRREQFNLNKLKTNHNDFKDSLIQAEGAKQKLQDIGVEREQHIANHMNACYESLSVISGEKEKYLPSPTTTTNKKSERLTSRMSREIPDIPSA